MDFISQLVSQAAGKVWITFTHNWIFLVISVLVAVSLKFFFDPNKVSDFLTRHQKGGVFGATLLAVGSPLCSCGTTAVVLGMMASMIPWAPIIAFMVSSPLTSPEQLIYSAGLFGWPFALVFFISSIILGLLGGFLGSFFESHGWLNNQTRFQNSPQTIKQVKSDCGCSSAPSKKLKPTLILVEEPTSSCSCSSTKNNEIKEKTSCGCENKDSNAKAITDDSTKESCDCNSRTEIKKGTSRFNWKTFGRECFVTGKRLLFMFLGFAFIGYFLNGLIPDEWVAKIFGAGNIYSVPLAATLGLPLYINTEASLPLVKGLIDGGMSQGAAIAFLITGAGTSIGALTGALTIARWRVIALVIGTLWVGAIMIGYIFNLLLSSGII